MERGIRNPWALTGYAAGQLLLAVPALVLFILWVTFLPLVIVTVGILGLAIVVPAAAWVASGFRVMAGQILGEPLEPSYRDVPGGPISRLRVWITDPARWRDLAGLFVTSTLGLVTSVIVISLLGGSLFYLIYPFLWWVTPAGVFDVPLGIITIDTLSETFLMSLGAVVLFALWWWVGGPLVRARARLDRAVFCRSRSEELQERVQVLTDSRAESIDHSAAELRRIERDLHDGPQARLVALGMNLGLLEELLDQDPEAARRLVAETRGSTGTRAQRAAVDGAGHPPAGPRRPRAGRRGRSPGAGHGAPCPSVGRPAREAAGPGGVGGLLRGRRVPGQHREARSRPERLDRHDLRRRTHDGRRR